MENKYIHLSTCNTCKRIAKDINLPESVEQQNVKEQLVDSDTIDWLKEQSGSYESLFNRRSQEYRKRGLHEKELTENDYKELLTDHYSFIKRPILILNDIAFIGNSKKVVEAAKSAIESNE